MWLPRLGRSETPSTSCPLQTPAALTTARRVNLDAGAGQLVAQLGTVAGELHRAAPGDHARAVLSSGARQSHDEPRVVFELAVPVEKATAQSVGADGRCPVEYLDRTDTARARQQRRGRPRGDAQHVAESETGAGKERRRRAHSGEQRNRHRERSDQVWRGMCHQDAAFDGTFLGDAEFAVPEVAQSAVHELRAEPTGAERQIVLVDKENREPS